MKRISMKTARRCADMTEEQACKVIGIDQYELIKWENGSKLPSIEQAVRMAEAYGLPLDVISFQKEDNTICFCHDNLNRRICMMYDSNKSFAKAIKMKPETLESRLSGETEFTLLEIQRMRKKLNVSESEVAGLFFCEKTDIVGSIAKLFSLMTDDEFETLQEIVRHGRPGSPAAAQI